MHTKQDHDEMHLKFETTGNIAHVKQDGLQYFVVYNEYQAGPFDDLLSALVNIYESSQSNGVPYTLMSAQTAQTAQIAHEPHYTESKPPVHNILHEEVNLHEEVKPPVAVHTYGEKKPPVTHVPTPEPPVREVSPVQEDEKKHATHTTHKAPYKSGRSGG